MTIKGSEVSYSQGKLLDHRNHDGMAIIEPGETFEAPTEEPISGNDDFPVEYGEPGSYVDVVERARNLKATLDGFNESNHNRGLSRAIAYKPEIQARYEGRVDKIQKTAERDAKGFFEEAERRFLQATGHEALRASGLAEPQEIDAQTKLMWQEFTDKYGQAGQSRQRRRLAKQLSDSIQRLA